MGNFTDREKRIRGKIPYTSGQISAEPTVLTEGRKDGIADRPCNNGRFK